MRLSLSELDDFSLKILLRQGFSFEHARGITDTVVAGERDECHSHGLYRLLGIVETLKAGKVSPDAKPDIVEQANSIVTVDACGGFSQLAFKSGLPILVEKARNNGIAALAINNCVHFSALWFEIEQLTDQGLIALAFTPSQAGVAPEGGYKPVFGTNPIAFGWPRAGKDPFVFDFATSVIARGDIELHRRAGKQIPLGWGVDINGQPSTDPSAVLEGAMRTFGGHKGSALAAMVELIAGPLIGDMTSVESLEWDEGTKSLPRHGELLIALDPKCFLGDAAERHLARAESLFDNIQMQGARLPSQRRYQARKRSIATGVELSDSLYSDLRNLLI